MFGLLENLELIDIARFSAIIGGSIVAALLAGFVTLKLLRWLIHYRSKHTEKIVNLNLRAPILLLYPLVAVFAALYSFYPAILSLPFIQAIGKVFLVILLIWISLRLIKIFAALIKRRFDINNPDNLRARAAYTQIAVVQRIMSFVVIVLGIASFFLLFDNLRGIGVSLVASAGVAGIVLGFAAQKTLGNLLAGIQIALSQPIRIDDVVIVEDEWGWVEEITLTYVVIRIWDLRRLILPISYFIEKPFQNWTRTSARILGSVFLYTDYTLPVDALREKTSEILKDHAKWDGDVNVVQVTNCKPETMELRVLISARNSPDAWDLRCDLREKLIAYIKEEHPAALPKTRAVLEPIEQPA